MHVWEHRLGLGAESRPAHSLWGEDCGMAMQRVKRPEYDWVGIWGCVRDETWVYYRSPLVKEHLEGEVGPSRAAPDRVLTEGRALRARESRCCLYCEVGLKSGAVSGDLCDFSGFTLPLSL